MHIHFIGIGGIGVSALARYYLSKGARVSGSDLMASEITDALLHEGAEIVLGRQQKKNFPETAEKVVFTAATPGTNPELREAKRRGIPLSSYAEAVGELSRQYKTITVSGAHGKSTTTALISLILVEGYCDPTVIIGTKVKEFGATNFRRGRSPYLVLEADEWNRSFLSYQPHIAVVTNIDAEHLDTYKTIEGVERAFRKYLERVPEDGWIVANADDARLRKIVEEAKKPTQWFSMHGPDAARVRNLLKVPGDHNVANALAALTVGRILGIQEPLILKALEGFRGTWRRFEFMGIREGAYIFSDYAHHPNEIIATLSSARKRFPFRRIWCVFQPHQYRRLQYLWDNFVSAFDGADRICLLPVYAVSGRERRQKDQQYTSDALAHTLLLRGKQAWHVPSFDTANIHITGEIKKGDVVLMMGAGDIYDFTKKFMGVRVRDALSTEIV
ncbi:MAG: UDP-N-acetylmuramate--alanine ligase [Parcubacteria group bacterium Gr01-1014_66]|nr:MAG: UDP-N-acetylmuramate--alanine ligase [Parcubacteria group bacterium Gr01-1014_66]